MNIRMGKWERDSEIYELHNKPKVSICRLQWLGYPEIMEESRKVKSIAWKTGKHRQIKGIRADPGESERRQ